jgi:zinc protease
MMVRLILLAWFAIATNVHAVDIEHWQTSNGARVYFVEAPELPMVDISVLFDAGSVRDGKQAGLALLTSAMLNEGAAGLDIDQIANAFADVGAQFSASAGRDSASVNLRSLTAESSLTLALDTFKKVLGHPDFPKTSLDRLQKQVLLGFEAEKQSPRALASRAFFSQLYGEHPYGEMPSGNADSVSLLTVADLKSFYDQYYVASNAVIAIVGAVDKARAIQVADSISANLKIGEKPEPMSPVMALTQAKQVHIPYPSSQTHIVMGQPGIARGDEDYFALYVGNHILGGSGLVSLISKEIREKRGLSYSSYSYFRPMREAGPYQFGLQTRNEQTEEALKVLRDTVQQFIKNGPTQQQLDAAKQNITGGFALRVDSNRELIGYVAMLGFYELPLDYLDTFKDNINAISVEQIKTVFQQLVDPEKMITVLVGGEAK